MNLFIIKHGAVLLFNVVQAITLFMVLNSKAFNVVPALSFVIFVNVAYILSCRIKER